MNEDSPLFQQAAERFGSPWRRKTIMPQANFLRCACPSPYHRAGVLLFWMPSSGGMVQRSRGQAAEALPAEQPTAITPQRRAELYQQLRRRAELLEAQTAVVKLAARLAGPTVVAYRCQGESGRRASSGGHSTRFGEAGAGVIIRWKGKVLRPDQCARDFTESSPTGIRLSLVDGRRLSADRVWEDLESDVAVMAVVRATNRRRRPWAIAMRWKSAITFWPSVARSA